MKDWLPSIRNTLKQWLVLPPDDLLRDFVYRRLWSSILISSFGGQISMLALPLTAAALLHASPLQMGALIFTETAPFVLFSLPSGVWLDRVRKLPVYITGEVCIALAMSSVPLAWWFGWLSMSWLYVVSLILGTVYTIAGSAAQIVLTQVVARPRLVEAHAKNALANSGATVAGPVVAGALIKLMGAPLALLADAAMLVVSTTILRGIRVNEVRPVRADAHFWRDLKAGVQFVADQRLLASLAVTVGLWQFCYNAALVVQILFATRILNLNAQAIGLSYMGMGLGTIIASLLGNRISRRFGPGPCLVIGIAVCGLGWACLALAPANMLGEVIFTLMLVCFSSGSVLIFINFLALRQAVTPEPMLGRMTSTMRWLTLIPSGPGALLGGWLGEHWGLRAALGFAGVASLALAALAWRHPVIRAVKVLPKLDGHEDWVGA